MTKRMEHELDNRGLSPPEPMMRTLQKLDQIDLRDVLWIHNDRIPAFLFPELEDRGCEYEVFAQADGTYRVRIARHE